LRGGWEPECVEEAAAPPGQPLAICPSAKRRRDREEREGGGGQADSRADRRRGEGEGRAEQVWLGCREGGEKGIEGEREIAAPPSSLTCGMHCHGWATEWAIAPASECAGGRDQHLPRLCPASRYWARRQQPVEVFYRQMEWNPNMDCASQPFAALQYAKEHAVEEK
jgi:hypothetical protein